MRQSHKKQKITRFSELDERSESSMEGFSKLAKLEESESRSKDPSH